MTGARRAAAGPREQPQRVRAAHVEAVAERMGERDWALVAMVNRLRLLRGDQIERLFFFDLAEGSRIICRCRVLRRLVAWRVLDCLPRRIGGSRRGSATSVYALGSAGQRLLLARQTAAGVARRVRHPGAVSERTIRHTLAISELYVGLVEQARQAGAPTLTFEAEPTCWWPDGLGGYLKPDAYLALEDATVRDHWWAEVDRATESLPTLRRKLTTYLSFVERGQLGPNGVIPRVLIVVPDERRREALQLIVEHLPEPAEQMFGLVTERHAAVYLFAEFASVNGGHK